ARIHLRGGAQLLARKVAHFADRIDHQPCGQLAARSLDPHDDDHGVVRLRALGQTEAAAQIDDWYDRAAQIDDALNVRRRMRQARGPLPALDLLYAQDLHSIVLACQLEGQILPRRNSGLRLRADGRCGGVHAAQADTVAPLPSTRSSVASSCVGLKGLSIQPVAPACLPCCLRSWLDSVVSSNSGVSRYAGSVRRCATSMMPS